MAAAGAPTAARTKQGRPEVAGDPGGAGACGLASDACNEEEGARAPAGSGKEQSNSGAARAEKGIDEDSGSCSRSEAGAPRAHGDGGGVVALFTERQRRTR